MKPGNSVSPEENRNPKRARHIRRAKRKMMVNPRHRMAWGLLSLQTAGAVLLALHSDLLQNNLTGLFYLEHRYTEVLLFVLPGLLLFWLLSFASLPDPKTRRPMTAALCGITLAFFIPYAENPAGLQSLLNDMHIWLEAAGLFLWVLLLEKPLLEKAVYGLPLSESSRRLCLGLGAVILVTLLLCSAARHICGAAQMVFLQGSCVWMLLCTVQTGRKKSPRKGTDL